jgi:hypothetical protein
VHPCCILAGSLLDPCWILRFGFDEQGSMICELVNVSTGSI